MWTIEGGKPGYRNTDEPEVPDPREIPKEFPDRRGDDPDGRPPERALPQNLDRPETA